MSYPSAADTFAAADARIELAQTLFARVQPIASTPAELYLTKTRKIPADAVRACADLRYLPSPIEGRPVVDHALVSVLRDAAGEVSGLQLEYCDILGARTAAEPFKQTFALREYGMRDGLFCAGGSGDVAYLCEGYSCKALAVASLGFKAYGGGGRAILGCAVPPEPTMVIVPDRRPDDKMVDLRTGRSAGTAHDQDYKRTVDLLLVAGKAVLVAKAPECQHAGGSACKDTDDYLKRHGPINLKGLIEATEVTALSLDGEARKLALTDDPLERDQATKAKATELKVKVALLRDRVVHYREAGRSSKTATETDATGSELVFEELRPAAEKQDGAELLDDIATAIRRHVFVDDAELAKAVLWVIHGHRRFHGNTSVLPRLVITAGRWDSEKSTLARVLKHLSDVAHYTTSPTPPNIFRPIEEHRCAFFLDETDNWFERSEGMRDIINSGFAEEEANVLRTEDTGTGGRRVLKSRKYSTFAPIAIIGLNLETVLPHPTISRAITIHMRPARVGEVVEEVTGNRRAVAQLRELAARVKRWVADNERALSVASPELPAGVINRLKLVWSPLLAIADQTGGSWPRRAREALEIDRGRERDPNLGEQLLLDMRDILEMRGHQVADDKAMHTGPIIEQLLKLELRTWSVFGRARTIVRDTDIARLLAPYEVRPSQIKLNALNRNGYRLSDIQAAIDRYVYVPRPCAPGAVYLSTSAEKPQQSAGFEVEDEVDGSQTSSTYATEVDPTSGAGSTCFSEQNQSGRQVDPIEHPTATQTQGNGRAVDDEYDRIIAEVEAGDRCAGCLVEFNGEDAELVGTRWYHRTKECAGAARAKAAPPKKRSLIKRPERPA